MKRKYLLSESGNDYKANLHCHTKLSDGGDTPLEIKEMYTQKGYSIVAFTDHDVFIPHPELCDENFLALNGFEIEIYDCNSDEQCPKFNEHFKEMRTTHIYLIALFEIIDVLPLFLRTKYYFCAAQKTKEFVKFDANEPDFERLYTADCINHIFKKGKEKGFFVTYNHPRWSLENYSVYSHYHGMDAIEIMNGGSLVSGFMDNDFQAFDDLLCQGKRVFAVAGDDNHGLKQSFVCWTVIRAEELSYKAISKALTEGNFYATNGPEIKEMFIADGKLCVSTSNVKNIIFTTAIRHRKNIYNEDGSPVNYGEFEIGENDRYVRVTLVGFDGTVAYGNPYFL